MSEPQVQPLSDEELKEFRDKVATAQLIHPCKIEFEASLITADIERLIATIDKDRAAIKKAMEERDCWLSNAKDLQKGYNEIEKESALLTKQLEEAKQLPHALEEKSMDRLITDLQLRAEQAEIERASSIKEELDSLTPVDDNTQIKVKYWQDASNRNVAYLKDQLGKERSARKEAESSLALEKKNQPFYNSLSEDFEEALGPHPIYQNGCWIQRVKELRQERDSLKQQLEESRGLVDKIGFYCAGQKGISEQQCTDLSNQCLKFLNEGGDAK